MKDVNLKNLKTTGVYTHSNKKPKEKKNDIFREKKDFSLGRKKDMIISNSSQENNSDRYQIMKKYLRNNFNISGIHIYTVETHPFKANLIIGEPLDNEALVMSYYSYNNTEILTSALGIHSVEIKSRMITQIYIEAVDFRSYIGKNYLIIYDSKILEAFRDRKDINILMEYTYKNLTNKLKQEGVK